MKKAKLQKRTAMNEQAYDQALTYLSRRNYSQAELAQKLQHKGYEMGEIRDVLARLCAAELVNDIALAQRLYERYVEEGIYGNAYIAYRLQKKGLEMPDRMRAEEENQRALHLVQTRLMDASGCVKKRKIASFLANRGYTPSTLYAVCEALGEAVQLDRTTKKIYNK